MRDKKRITKMISKVRFTLMMGLTNLVLLPQKVFAEEWDFLTEDGNGAFTNLDETAKATGSSLYNLLRTLGIIALFASIMLVGMSFMIHKSNASKREENKTGFFWVCIGGAIVFGVFGLLGIISGIGAGISGEA